MFRKPKKVLYSSLILILSLAVLVPSVSAASVDSSKDISDGTLTTAPVDSSKTITTGALTAAPPASDFVAKFVPVQSTASTKSGVMSATSSSDYQYLVPSSCTSSIYNKATLTMVITGITQANTVVDFASVSTTLQRYDGTNWNSVLSGPGQQLKDTTAAAASGGTNIWKGYYYRTMSYHVVQKGLVYETAYSYSPAALATQ
ncbi:hypothetical protein [Gorillibacterium massiliense]|uniref:hypothetical protein n=1 Tax=Gorillibacterium massiliense TaxID=1280390 RepID=UPI0004B2AEE3|nr:hypothetical protein [Gorillibacterium massiliense]